MSRRYESDAARPGAGLVELKADGWMDPALWSVAVRLCIVHGTTHVIPVEPKYSFRKSIDQMPYYCCSQCCPQSTTIHHGARRSPTEKSLTHFYRRARFSPLVCICIPWQIAVWLQFCSKSAVSSTGLLFKCPPMVMHSSLLPLLFLLCFPVTVTFFFLPFSSHIS